MLDRTPVWKPEQVRRSTTRRLSQQAPMNAGRLCFTLLWVGGSTVCHNRMLHDGNNIWTHLRTCDREAVRSAILFPVPSVLTRFNCCCFCCCFCCCCCCCYYCFLSGFGACFGFFCLFVFFLCVCTHILIYASVYIYIYICTHTHDRLVGQVVRRPPRERKIPGSNLACAGIFSGSSHTSDLNIGTPVATLPGARRYGVSTGTGRPGVSIL